MGPRLADGVILILIAPCFWALVVALDNVYLPFLEGLYFHAVSVCTDTLHYMTSDPEDLAFRLQHNLDPEGLRTVLDPVLNRTVAITRPFREGEFVCEYSGEHIDKWEMLQRLAAAAYGDFGYILTYENTIREELYIVDAKPESDGRCRLINHSWKRTNVDVYPVLYRGEPRLIFLALRSIAPGEELFFDYGYEGMEPEVVQRFQWLKE